MPDEAKRLLCAAISDRRIAIRLVLAADVYRGLDEMEVPIGQLRIPPRLKPDEVDWTKSLPLTQWFPQPHRLEEPVTCYGARVIDLLERKVAVIDLRTADVIALFGGASQPIGADLPPERAEPRSAAGAKSRVVSQVVAALWPNGIPDGLTIKERNNRIKARAGENNLSVPSAQTIRRALKQSNA